MTAFTVIDWPGLNAKMESLPDQQMNQLLETLTRLKDRDPEAVRLSEVFELGKVSPEFVLMALSG
mgnify:CR=1 FL=1